MSKILEQLKKLFNTPTALERYIESKKPTSPAEVDYWLRQYDTARYRGL
jgi:hypothetical protein